jgi:hypothetical protein
MKTRLQDGSPIKGLIAFLFLSCFFENLPAIPFTPNPIILINENAYFSLLFDFQIGMTTWYSMLKMTAQIMTDANVVRGMKAQ